MTVAEIRAMIKGMKATDKVTFVGTTYDRDGYENDCFVEVKAIASANAEMVKDENGCDVCVDFR